MFTWLNSQGVRSDRGFEVQSKGRFSIHYREGEKKIDVHVERGITKDGQCCVIIDSTAFERWDDDPSYVVLSPDKQNQILNNFTEAMEFQDIAVVVS